MKNESFKENKVLDKCWKTTKILVILFVLIYIMTIFVAHRYIQKAEDRLVNDQDYPLLDPLRKFIAAENYIINIQDFRSYLHDLEDQYPTSLSVYYEQINSGSNISVNKNLNLFPASLSKLVQAIIVAKKVEKGSLSWDDRLKPQIGDLSMESGDLYKTIGDKSLTVEELMQELLVNSDNTAQNIFRHILNVQDYIHFQGETGLQDLYNEKGFISAKEYTRILRVLYTSSYLRPENSDKILDYLSKAKFKDYLSQGIPEDVVFAHKYGENKEYSVFLDSGIVYVPSKPYMLTVMIKGKDSTNSTREWAKSLMKDISSRAYQASSTKVKN